MSVTASTADAASPRERPKPKLATPRELADTLSKAFGGGSMLLALALGIEEVAMEPEEARDIAEPAARLLAQHKWTRGIAKRLAGASDWIDLALASALYGLRIYPLIYDKFELAAGRAIPYERSAAARQAQPIQHPAAQQQPGRARTAQQQPQPQPGPDNGWAGLESILAAGGARGGAILNDPLETWSGLAADGNG